MSNDSQGPDAPRGDNPESNDFAAAEDFLGLHANQSGADPGASEPTHDPGLPPEFAQPELSQPDLGQPEPADDGIYDPMAAAEATGGIYDPGLDSAPESVELDPTLETQVSTDLDGSGEGDSFGDDAPSGDTESDDDFDLDFDEEGASWLMEFDGAVSDEEQEEAFAQAFEDTEEEPVDPLDDDFRPSLAEPEMAGESSPWVGRAVLAIVSVAVGVVGSKFIAEGGIGTQPNSNTEIAKVEQPRPGKSTKPGNAAQPGNQNPTGAVPGQPEDNGGAQGAGANAKPAGQNNKNAKGNQVKPQGPQPGNPMATGSDTNPVAMPKKPGTPKGSKPANGDSANQATALAKGSVPFVKGANNSGGASGPLKPGQVPDAAVQKPATEVEPTGVVIQVGDTALTTELVSGEIETNANSGLVEEEHGSLRKASQAELASVWTGDSIPRDAVHAEERLLTPGVGEVRVLLTAGEVFEGKLYAVGNRRIWLETKIGKMALLEWQIDSYEKIADSTTLALGNEKTVAGLQSVRVRTAGGVFYGKLVSHQGSTVTIITASGARLTLENAELATAGRSTSHVVDASDLVIAEAETEAK